MSIRQFAAATLCIALMPSLASAAPVFRWTFDEASGDALDTGVAPPWAPGSVSNGVLTGGAVRSSNTPSGRGYSVDLRNDSPYAHVLGGDADKLERFGSITITTWLNVEQYTSGGPSLASKIGSSNQPGNHASGFSLSINPPNDGAAGPDNFGLRFDIAGGGDDPITVGIATSTADVDAANKWVMLAVTYDFPLPFNRTDTVRFYIGDVDSPVTQLGSPRTVGQIVTSTSPFSGGQARFGVGFRDTAPATDNSVIGYQDDVRVYHGALRWPSLRLCGRRALCPSRRPARSSS